MSAAIFRWSAHLRDARSPHQHARIAMLASVLLHAGVACLVPWTTGPHVRASSPAALTVRLVPQVRPIDAAPANAPPDIAATTPPISPPLPPDRVATQPVAAPVRFAAVTVPEPARQAAAATRPAIDGSLLVEGDVVISDGELGAELFERRMREFPLEVAYPVRVNGHVLARYPPAAAAAGIEGEVVLWAVLDGNGLIEELQVMSGPDALHDAALDAVRGALFMPAAMNGVGIRYPITLQFAFRLPPLQQPGDVAVAPDAATP